MQTLLLWAALAVAAEPLEDGSLLFLENASSVVELSTRGKIGHVALVFNGYSAEEVAAMRAVLDAQLGRRYSVRNYVRTKPGDGIHCAELASSVLNASGRFRFENNAKIHPAALFAAIDKRPHYGPAEEVLIAPAAKEPWCARAQRRTAQWFNWCGWSLREAWLWCW
jgi:hypothetical protein